MKEIDLTKNQILDPPVEMWVWDHGISKRKKHVCIIYHKERCSYRTTECEWYMFAKLIKPEYMTTDEIREFCEKNPVVISFEDEDFKHVNYLALDANQKYYKYKIWQNGKWSEPREFLK